MAKLPTRKRIFNLAGESQLNADGSFRQDILRNCVPGTRVTFQREPDNQYDPNAILVLCDRGLGIGFIGRDDAAMLAPALDAGRMPTGRIHELRGGLPAYPSLGCIVSLSWEGQEDLDHKPLKEEQSLYALSPGARWGASTPAVSPVLLVAIVLAVLLFLSLVR